MRYVFGCSTEKIILAYEPVWAIAREKLLPGTSTGNAMQVIVNNNQCLYAGMLNNVSKLVTEVV